MTDTVDTTLNTDSIVDTTSELQTLKDMANTMGIKYSNNISIETLKNKINEARKVPLKEVDPEIALREKLKKEKLALVRVNVTNLNPDKRYLNGDIFTVGNKYIGTVRRFVPFNTPWHIEKVIYEFIKSKQYASRYEVTRENRTTTEVSLVPEYSIQVLPNLTKEELDDLAKAQLARNSIED